jgi:ubiquinone/menaquinone biosynthesis C-methylase UbiE
MTAGNTSEWQGYDAIAERYDRVWSTRFESVARRIWTLIPVRFGAAVLDLGCGTGIVTRILTELNRQPRLIVGCDRSPRMLNQALLHVPELRACIGDATALPISTATFDIVTASFVLSHVRDYRAALRETFRVLKPSGEFAVSGWAPPSDPYSAVWRECLAETISKEEVERASADVVPSEAHFSETGRLESELRQAGFSIVASEAPEFEFMLRVDEFIEDRELSSGGRLGRHLLGRDLWARFCATARERILKQFGDSLCYRNCALIVVGKKP